MKKLIDDFIKQNDNVLNFLETTGGKHKNADTVIPLFADFLRHTNFNVALGVNFANLLQLSNDSSIFERYDLADISKLFESLLKVQDSNLEAYVEAGHFEWAVMDNKEKAKAIVSEGVEKAKEKVKELEALLKTLDSE